MSGHFEKVVWELEFIHLWPQLGHTPYRRRTNVGLPSQSKSCDTHGQKTNRSTGAREEQRERKKKKRMPRTPELNAQARGNRYRKIRNRHTTPSKNSSRSHPQHTPTPTHLNTDPPITPPTHTKQADQMASYLRCHVARASRLPRHVVPGVVHLALRHDSAKPEVEQLHIALSNTTRQRRRVVRGEK